MRAQDYQQGRKTAGAFGQSSFGGAAQPSTTGAFGQPAQPAATNSIFGGASAFGANNNQTPSATGAFGTFGQTPAATGTSTFGGGSVFGQNSQQQQPSTGFGTFGQTQPAATTNAFGGGGVFGQNNNQSKPAGAFGSLGNSNSIFFVIFIHKLIFLQLVLLVALVAEARLVVEVPSGTIRNSNNLLQVASLARPNLNRTRALSGRLVTPIVTATRPRRVFSGSPLRRNQLGVCLASKTRFNNQRVVDCLAEAQFLGRIITNSNSSPISQLQPVVSCVLGLSIFTDSFSTVFGSQHAAQPATGGSIFGGGGGLFGNNNQQQPPQNNSFGIFGQKPATTTPATGSLFGSSTLGQTNTTGQQSGSLFGSTNTQTGTAGSSFGGGGLFGNKPAAAPALGQSQSLFGNSGTLTTTTPGQPLTASIAQPIGANLPIFSLLPPGPRAVPLEQPKKKPGFFVDVPTRSPVPRLQLGYTPANTKLRGFGPDSSSSLAFSTGRPNALSLSRVDNNTPAGADGFLRNSSLALGSGGHGSVKKLILDKKVEPSDFFSKTASLGSRSSPGKVTFNPAMSQAARERDIARETASASPLNRISSPTPFIRPPNPPNHFSANSMNHVTEPKANGAATPAADDNSPQEGDYWVKPDLDALRRTGYQELSSFSGLVVGRIGYGEIHFLEPVDLTGLSKLDELQGLVVRFDDKECTVYPDSDDADKPAPGTGLNVKARITLIRCWAVDKATREPIKDEKHPSAVKHLKRLKNMRDTQFESFDVSEGKWTFAVDHF